MFRRGYDSSSQSGVNPNAWRNGSQNGWHNGTQGNQVSRREERRRGREAERQRIVNSRSDWEYGGRDGQGYDQGYTQSRNRGWNRVHNGYDNYYANEEMEHKTLTSAILAGLNKVTTKMKPAAKKGVAQECKEVKYNNCLAFGDYEEAECKVVEKP